MNSRDLDESGSLNFEEFLMAMPANLVNIPKDEHKYVYSRILFILLFYFKNVCALSLNHATMKHMKIIYIKSYLIDSRFTGV